MKSKIIPCDCCGAPQGLCESAAPPDGAHGRLMAFLRALRADMSIRTSADARVLATWGDALEREIRRAESET